MAKAFAQDLGVTLQFVDSSFADLIQNMTTDVCDVSMHAVGIRPDRAEHMDFSDPLLHSGIYAIAARTSSIVSRWTDIDQPGHVVEVLKGTFMEPVMRKILKNAHLKVVEAPKQRELDVESGRADVFMTDYPYGQKMISQTSWAVLVAPPSPLAPTSYAYAVPKGEPDWLARVNAFVRAAKADGRLAAFAKAHGLSPIVAE
jgi:ABC-type amino acid transport substrate-binding protein